MEHLVNIIVLLTVTGQIQQACSTSCVSRYSPKTPGTCIEPSQCTGAALPGICTSSPGTVCCISSKNGGDPVMVKNIYISKNIFYKMFGKTRRSMSLYPYYIKALDDAGVSTREQIAAFTAQILYETSNLTLTEEDNDGLQYEGSTSLGNNQPGDGPRFRGRGIIPIRGRHMYKVVADGISQDLEDAPESASMPAISFQIAAWLWKNGYQSADKSLSNTEPLKKYVNNTKYGFALMSYAIFKWQDENSMAEKRFPFWLKVIEILNATCPSDGKGPECTAGERKGACKLASACKGKSVENLCDGAADIECCVECNNPVDLVFVVDSSGSVGPVNFKLAMDFLTNVTMRFDVSASKDGSQVALIRFSSGSEIVFNFKKFKSNEAVKHALMSVRFKRGGTRIDLALQMALNHLFKTSKNGVRPKSLGVTRILILLTDGKNNGPTDSVRKPVDALRWEGVNIFSVGIGRSIDMGELKTIASDPDEDHVFLSNSFNAVQKLVEAVQTASCNEPALLDSGTTTSVEIQRKANKFFKYQNHRVEDITVLMVNPILGSVDVRPSLTNKNPLKDAFHSCGKEDAETELKEFVKESYCSSNPQGGILVPEQLNRRRKLKIACAKMCSCQNIYVGVKGLVAKNSFNISLLNYSDSNMNIEELFANENNSTGKNYSAWTFPLESHVYVGSAVAATATMATLAAYVTISCAGKSVEVKCSSKIKRKTKNEPNNESGLKTTNTEHDGVPSDKGSPCPQGPSRNVSLISSIINATKRRSCTTVEPFLSNQCRNEARENKGLDEECVGEHNCAPESRNKDTGACEIELVQNKPLKNKIPASLNSNYNSDKRKTQNERQKIMSRKDQVDSKSLKLQSKVGFSRPNSTKTDKNNNLAPKTKFEKRTENSKDKTAPMPKNGVNKTKNFSLNREHLQPIRETEKKRHTKENKVSNDDFHGDSEVRSSHKIQNDNQTNVRICSSQETKGRENNSISCVGSPSSNNSTVNDVVKLTSQSQPNDKLRGVKPSHSSFKTFPSAMLCSCGRSSKLEGTKVQGENKVNVESRKKFHLGKNHFLTVAWPCFTVFIADDEGINEEEASELRERRFERDMHLSQAFCVLLTQVIFMVGIHARENEIGCAAAAIAMNYLYLVAMVWLLIEAYYLYKITQRNKEKKIESAKSKRKFYVFAWGLPLVTVLLMAINSRKYSTNPHCWVSMTDSLDIAVSLPLVTVGLVQLILFGLMFKVLFTYKKTTNDEEKEIKKEILKTGLRNIVCIALTVMISWIMGTVSVNIDKHVYQTAFTVWNTLQGTAFLLFHVFLNEETRKIILTIINHLKKGSVSPLEDHEHVEVEEEKEKQDNKNKKNQEQTSHQNSIAQEPVVPTTNRINVSRDKKSLTIDSKENCTTDDHTERDGQTRPNTRQSLPRVQVVVPTSGKRSRKINPTLTNAPKKKLETLSTRKEKTKATGNNTNIKRKQKP